AGPPSSTTRTPTSTCTDGRRPSPTPPRRRAPSPTHRCSRRLLASKTSRAERPVAVREELAARLERSALPTGTLTRRPRASSPSGRSGPVSRPSASPVSRASPARRAGPRRFLAFRSFLLLGSGGHVLLHDPDRVGMEVGAEPVDDPRLGGHPSDVELGAVGDLHCERLLV